MTAVVGAAHEAGVERLLDSYRAIPAGERVRLAKRTSNLFRPRAASTTPGLDTSGLTGVVEVDADARTADVQGMCTYEHLVDATLPHGLTPLVVPQLRTITLGGAVTGLGIESASWRNGLPHESVLEMDVLTGSGEVVTRIRPLPASQTRFCPVIADLRARKHCLDDECLLGRLLSHQSTTGPSCPGFSARRSLVYHQLGH